MHQAQWSPERPLPPPVSLASQSHHEKPPEVTCTSRGNPGFPASTRERPRETFFNTSRRQSPLPWLGSNDALPLATRMETRLPCRPTRGSLTSPRSEEHTSELQSPKDIVCRLLLEKKKKKTKRYTQNVTNHARDQERARKKEN